MRCQKFAATMRHQVCLARREAAGKFPGCEDCLQGAEVALGRFDDQDIEDLRHSLVDNRKKVALAPTPDPKEKAMTEKMTPAVKDAVAPRCKNHPERPQHQNKKGRPLGVCKECLQDRMKNAQAVSALRLKQKTKNKKQKPSLLSLDFRDYPALRDRLARAAAADFRTPEQQALFLIDRGLMGNPALNI